MKKSMKLTGVEVPTEALFKLEPNTFLAIISDKDGNVRVIKVEAHDDVTHSIPADTALSVTEANAPISDAVSSMAKRISATPCGAPRCCLKYQDGEWVWVPC